MELLGAVEFRLRRHNQFYDRPAQACDVYWAYRCDVCGRLRRVYRNQDFTFRKSSSWLPQYDGGDALSRGYTADHAWFDRRISRQNIQRDEIPSIVRDRCFHAQRTEPQESR